MDILRSILDGIAIAALFNGVAAAVIMVNPRFFLDSYPLQLQKAVPVPMTKYEKKVNTEMSYIVMIACIGYEVVSHLHMGINGFWNLFWSGYINWIIVNFADFFFLDCFLILGKCKDRIILPGTEGHPDYEAKNWMKHLALPEHFLLWPLVLVPVFSAIQAGIIMLIRMF